MATVAGSGHGLRRGETGIGVNSVGVGLPLAHQTAPLSLPQRVARHATRGTTQKPYKLSEDEWRVSSGAMCSCFIEGRVSGAFMALCPKP